MGYNVHGDLLKTYGHNLTTLRALVRDLPDDVVRKQGTGDETWSILEVVCHLRDTEEDSFAQVRSMVEEDRPQLSYFDQDQRAAESDYQSLSLEDALDAFQRFRHTQIAYLQNLSDEEWNRAGKHEEEGEITVQDVTAHMVAHDSIHLAQISRRILETRG